MEWLHNLAEYRFRPLDANQSQALYDAIVKTKEIFDKVGYEGIENQIVYA
jgi:hypothetical protein